MIYEMLLLALYSPIATEPRVNGLGGYFLAKRKYCVIAYQRKYALIKKQNLHIDSAVTAEQCAF